MSETRKPSKPAPEPKPAPSPEEDPALKKQKARKRRLRALGGMILRMVMLMLVLYILFFHLVGLTFMPNEDMYPRIDAGDMVLFYRLEGNFRAQDIIVFEKPKDSLNRSVEEAEEVQQDEPRPEKVWWRKALDWLGVKDPAEPEKSMFICRVVAGPGDTVEISEGNRLLVNGNAMVETNIFYPTPEYTGFVTYPLKLDEGEYFVLADHRDGGADSRFFGAVDKDEILGTVITILRRNNL